MVSFPCEWFHPAENLHKTQLFPQEFFSDKQRKNNPVEKKPTFTLLDRHDYQRSTIEIELASDVPNRQNFTNICQACWNLRIYKPVKTFYPGKTTKKLFKRL